MHDTPDPAVVARWITERREHLGLAEETLARRAAMAPAYLRHLLEAGPAFDPAGFVRIAAALGTTTAELVSGRADAPPGQGGPGPRPRLLGITEAECWDLVGSHGIGRIALPVEPGPVVYPVNYVVDHGSFAYRTGEHAGTAPEEGAEVSFQVDHIDEYLGRGWSVLAIGAAHYVDEPEELERLNGLPGAAPWAGGARPRWVRVSPTEVTGRRLVTG
ncbi:pyridoxamine 5'-phosphate oxidase family protein [Streptomyces sp. FH025]|uniref:pyridoxamine 5'-phosphate oxidase family protein n=1 Tax=Streptomyces sp. FH025 TaxID=2815937 RepID=UPI001A9D77F9|nr:pyridoxamine 5'-phosphate oxidase family protein [Streptomyces sp. FH025]MBO1414341.1 pyridoxamine 5'-phosphate oxidase family protein [Streptomyces sp. FH025]